MRPAESTNAGLGYRTRGFVKDFADREIEGLTTEEMRVWCEAHPGNARYVRAMWNDLRADGIVTADHFSTIRLPRPGKRPVAYPSPEQLKELISCASGIGRYFLAAEISFAAYTGLRAGEQAAILRSPMERAGNRLLSLEADQDFYTRGEVEWQRCRDGTLRRPKTKTSYRRYVIFPVAGRALASVREKSDEGSAFVFRSRPAHDHDWNVLRRETGLHFRWHSLRHFHATWLLDRGGKLEDVAVQLGVSRQVVEDTYGHPDDDLALARLEALR
jgi:integrase